MPRPSARLRMGWPRAVGMSAEQKSRNERRADIKDMNRRCRTANLCKIQPLPTQSIEAAPACRVVAVPPAGDRGKWLSSCPLCAPERSMLSGYDTPLG